MNDTIQMAEFPEFYNRVAQKVQDASNGYSISALMPHVQVDGVQSFCFGITDGFRKLNVMFYPNGGYAVRETEPSRKTLNVGGQELVRTQIKNFLTHSL